MDKEKEETVEEVCDHMETYLVPVSMGYIEKCCNCHETVEKRKFEEV